MATARAHPSPWHHPRHYYTTLGPPSACIVVARVAGWGRVGPCGRHAGSPTVLPVPRDHHNERSPAHQAERASALESLPFDGFELYCQQGPPASTQPPRATTSGMTTPSPNDSTVGTQGWWGPCGCQVGWLLPILFALFFFIIPAPLAHAANNGRIFGQLLNGTNHNAPVVGQSVTLQMAQGDNARDLATIKTDAHGGFAFNGLATDKTLNYAIYTRYQGAQYYTSLIDLSIKTVQQINLTVYEATTSTDQIAIVQATVLLHQPDAQVGVLSISEVFFFKNVGTSTYVGSLNASSRVPIYRGPSAGRPIDRARPNALLFTLPPGARNLSLDKGFDGYQAIQVDRGFASDAALPPGTSQFIFSFELPYATSNYDLSYDIVYPTVQFSLLLPPSVNLNSNTLTSAGLITADQHPYRLFQAKDLLAGAHIQTQLQGLPVTQTSPLNQRNIWLIVAVLLALAILSATWFLLRSTRRSQSNRKHNKKSQATPRSRPEKTQVIANDDMQSRQQALLQELLDLDKAYEAGKLKKAPYQERRAKTKARLRALMSEAAEKTAKSKGGV